MEAKKQISGHDEQQGNPKGDYHVPVLLQEAIDALKIQPSGIYVD
jgi:hypothetical protein